MDTNTSIKIVIVIMMMEGPAGYTASMNVNNMNQSNLYSFFSPTGAGEKREFSPRERAEFTRRWCLEASIDNVRFYEEKGKKWLKKKMDEVKAERNKFLRRWASENPINVLFYTIFPIPPGYGYDMYKEKNNKTKEEREIYTPKQGFNNAIKVLVLDIETDS